MINKAGELVDHLVAAAEGHGMTPHTDVLVRIGTLGAEYRISALKGQRDERGVRMILELALVPENG